MSSKPLPQNIEAEQLIEELSKSNRWVNILLEKKDIDELYVKVDISTFRKWIQAHRVDGGAKGSL